MNTTASLLTLALLVSQAPDLTTKGKAEGERKSHPMSGLRLRSIGPALMSGRADVAAAGLLVLGAALERIGATEFLATAGGLRHGLALQAAAGE